MKVQVVRVMGNRWRKFSHKLCDQDEDGGEGLLLSSGSANEESIHLRCNVEIVFVVIRWLCQLRSFSVSSEDLVRFLLVSG